MKVNFDLYSAHPFCGYCTNFYHKMDQSADGMGYCGVVSAAVDKDYYCSFYRIKSIKNTSQTAVDSAGKIITPDKDKIKKL